jgi:hypothetical protein
LKEFNIEGIKSKSDEKGINLAYSTLLWLVHIIKCCDRFFFEIMPKVFCEDTNICNSIIFHIVERKLFECMFLDKRLFEIKVISSHGGEC